MDRNSTYFYIDLKIWKINQYYVHILDNHQLVSIYVYVVEYGKSREKQAEISSKS